MITATLARTAATPLRVSVLLGALYFATLAWQPYPASGAVKGLSIATLAWLAWSQGARLLALGLAASSLGDVLLDVRSPEPVRPRTQFVSDRPHRLHRLLLP